MARETVTDRLRLAQRHVSDSSYRLLPEHLHPVLRRVYAARHMGPTELSPSLSMLLPVSTLGGTAEAATFLSEARLRQASIVVLGDFDADGATATALMVTALRGMGFSRVHYLVPSRFEFGYGLSPEVAGQAARLRPDILITVDNGITSVEGVARAKELGMEVVITDHHLPGAELPGARVIVNPNLTGEGFQSKALAGVGVAFYVMAVLARELERLGLAAYEQSRRVVTDCLDLVALGTIADLVRLDHNNRVLVAEGLRRIRGGRARPGLTSLFSVAGRDPIVARSADLGFAIAPRLNAAGRLADMSLGIECLLSSDDTRARQLAQRLDELNVARQDLQIRMQSEAEEHLDRLGDELAGGSQHATCLFDPGWHEGIVGLVASRVKERTGRPVVAFAPGEKAGVLKGSARSVDGLHIRDVLAAIAARDDRSEMKFGGHAMAAGLRLPAERLDWFREAFNDEVRRHLAGVETGCVLWTDGPLSPGELGLELAEELHFAGPWGQGFPEPLFDNEFTVLDQRLVKDAHLRLSLRHPQGAEPLEAIAFSDRRSLPGLARFVYRLGVNDFGGRRRRQLVVEHIQCD